MGPVGIIITIVIGVVGWIIYIRLSSPQRKFKEACMVYERIEKLRPEQMSVGEPLAQEYESRDQDKELRGVLEAGEKWPLLRGNTWTGKSHSAYEALKCLSQGGLKGYWVIRPMNEVKPEDIHLLKQFPCRRPKVVLVLDNLESYGAGKSGANRINEITQRFRLQSEEMRVLATMRTESEFVDAARVAQMDIAWPRFKSIDFNSPIPDMVVSNEPHLEDMRTKYRSLQDAPKKILWALKILRKARVTTQNERIKALFVEILNGEEKEFEAGLKRLKDAGFAGSPRSNVTEVHDIYLERVVEDFSPKPEEICQFLVQSAELFEKRKDIGALNQIGISLHLNQKYDDALRCSDAILRITEENDFAAWNNKGNAFDALGRHEDAIECYEKALELREDFWPAWLNKGCALDDLGQCEEAIQCFNKVIELWEDFMPAWYDKGIALDGLGRHEEALECYDKALELTDFRYPDVWYSKACAFAGLKEKDKMLDALEEAVRLDPENKAEAKRDEDFKAYWEDEDFKAIVE